MMFSSSNVLGGVYHPAMPPSMAGSPEVDRGANLIASPARRPQHPTVLNSTSERGHCRCRCTFDNPARVPGRTPATGRGMAHSLLPVRLVKLRVSGRGGFMRVFVAIGLVLLATPPGHLLGSEVMQKRQMRGLRSQERRRSR
jgi:hypothetical protein